MNKPPTIEIDHQAGAVYVRFARRGKVFQSHTDSRYPGIRCDKNEEGQPLGIEFIGKLVNRGQRRKRR
jgi:hypothetical protein